MLTNIPARMVFMVAVMGAAQTGYSAEPTEVHGYPQVNSFVAPDYSWVPRKLSREPIYASTKPRYALLVLGNGRKTVLPLVWDEAQGPGTGYDTLYADVDLDGDLTEANEKFVWENNPKRQPVEKYTIPTISEVGGDGVFSLRFETHGEPDTLSYASGYSWERASMASDGKAVRTTLWLHHLPFNSSIQWRDTIATAPVHHLGGEIIPLPSHTSGIRNVPGKTAANNSPNAVIVPGTFLGAAKAGETIGLGWRLASLGSDAPSTELRCSAGSGQTYVRLLKADGSIERELPMMGACSCAETFGQSLLLPLTIRPGRHQVIYRSRLDPIDGGPRDFIYPIEIENPFYGAAIPDVATARLKESYGKVAHIISLRRAADPGQLTGLFPGEQVVAASIADTWFDCFHREGFLYYLNENRGSSEVLQLGPRAWAADTNRGLIQVDLSGLGKSARIEGAILRLAIAVNNITKPENTTLAAYAVRREWNELPATDGSYACQLGPKYKLSQDRKSVDPSAVLWATPGAMDSQQDRCAEPAAVFAFKTMTASTGTTAEPAFIQLDITDVARQWHAGTLPNHGLLLVVEGEGTIDIHASESATCAFRPTLVVASSDKQMPHRYTVPPGEDIQAARARSATEGKPLLVIFSSERCKICKDFKAGSLVDPAVAEQLTKHFVVQALDPEHWPELADKLELTGIPTAVVLKPGGVLESGRMQGKEILDKTKFLHFLTANQR